MLFASMDPDHQISEDSEGSSREELGEPESMVRRSDEDLAHFDAQRIVETLVREASVEEYVAVQIGSEVRELIQKLGFRALSSTLIRGLVDARLLEMGLESAYRAHTRLGVPLYDVERMIHSRFREAIPQPYGPEGTSAVLAEAIKREYAILNVFSEQIANAHLVGDIHIHSIGAIDRPHSLMSSVDYVKRFGIVLPHAFATSRPSRRPEVLIAHIVKLSAALQGHLAGPVVWDSLNFGIAPLLEDADDRAIKQLAQNLIFEFSAPAVARGGQVISSCLHLDWDAPSYLKSRPAIGAGGEVSPKTYAEYTGVAHRFLEALLEVYIEGDGAGHPFLTPKLVLHLGEGFDQIPGHREILELACHLALERGGLDIVFERDEATSFANRYYGLDDPTVEPGVETHSFRASQFQHVSLNLPRVGYLAAGSQVQVFEELTRLIETAAQAHLEKRVFLEKLLAMGEQGPLAVLTTRCGDSSFLKLSQATHAIGIVGLNELCRTVLGAGLHESDESMEFAVKTMAHLRSEAARLSRKHKVRFLLTAESAEPAVHRLAALDLRFLGDTAGQVACGDPVSRAVYYTDGARLADSAPVSVADRVRIEGSFHRFGFANPNTEIWIGDPSIGAVDLSRLVLIALNQSQSSGLVICPEFTICYHCGAARPALRDSCLVCGSTKVDHLAYAADRYGHASSWKPGRLAELRGRKRVTRDQL
jgi:ribonucleoside-triphosphate reductase